MNKNRRKIINQEVNKIKQVKELLQCVLNEEQIAFDNMPENLQYSTKGEQSEEAIEYIEEAIDLLDNAIEALENV